LSEDEGLYFCEARNEKEKVKSQPAYLLPAGTSDESTFVPGGSCSHLSSI